MDKKKINDILNGVRVNTSAPKVIRQSNSNLNAASALSVLFEANRTRPVRVGVKHKIKLNPFQMPPVF